PPDGKQRSAQQASTSSSLLERAKAGDADSWRRLTHLYTPLLLWWCRRQGLRDQDAENVAQEVFLMVFAKVAGFTKRHQRGSFRSGLRNITDNKIRESRRRALRDV